MSGRMKWRAIDWNIRRQVWAVFALFLLTAMGVVVLDEIGQHRSRQSLQMLKDHSLLGLRRIKAAGTEYKWAMFDKDIRAAIATMPKPDDGEPVDLFGGLDFKIGLKKAGPKPCTAAIGVRGGKSRGAGSGSRLRLFVCDCPSPIKVRVARDEFDCTCNTCNTLFKRG